MIRIRGSDVTGKSMKPAYVVGSLKFFIDYIVAPGLAWAAALYGGLDWVGRTSEVNRSLLAGAAILLIVSAYAYQTGYKGFYRAGRTNYFLAVFIAPILVGAVGLVAGLVFGHR
jgi:hypothetical protein